jgi:HlyD family secretion protein
MENNGKRRKKKKVIIFSIMGVLILALVLIVVLGSNRDTIYPVNVEQVSRKSITQIVTATGKIQPEVMVKISPEVSGEIVALPVKEGQRVKKGDLLLKIKPDFYKAQRDQFAAGLLQAQASLTRTESEFKRINNLFQKGLVSESEFDQARAAYESNKASYAQSRASLDQAEENLSKTTILSPMDGTVSQLKSELGERVLGTNQFQGTDVMTIADLSRMEARVEVGETDVILVSVGDTARVDVDAFPDKKIIALVYEIANTATSRGLGTQEEVTNFEVRMRIQNQGVNLRPGMSMTAEIETETRNQVLAVPIQSVTVRIPKEEEMDEEEKQFIANTTFKKKEVKPQEVVFVVENGMAKTIPVKRGISNDAYVEIIEGVTEGQQIVSGSYKAINRELENESKVRIEEKAKDRGKQMQST